MQLGFICDKTPADLELAAEIGYTNVEVFLSVRGEDPVEFPGKAEFAKALRDSPVAVSAVALHNDEFPISDEEGLRQLSEDRFDAALEVAAELDAPVLYTGSGLHPSGDDEVARRTVAVFRTAARARLRRGAPPRLHHVQDGQSRQVPFDVGPGAAAASGSRDQVRPFPFGVRRPGLPRRDRGMGALVSSFPRQGLPEDRKPHGRRPQPPGSARPNGVRCSPFCTKRNTKVPSPSSRTRPCG